MYLRDYPREELEEIVKQSSNMREVLRKLGYSTTGGRNTWTLNKRIDELGINTSHFSSVKGKKRSDEELFIQNSDATNNVVRNRIKKKNLIEYKCDICGLGSEWNGKPITLILDHKNGNNTDNRLENLHWVCPNCNSQLETTGFRGVIKYDSHGNKIEDKRKDKIMRVCATCGNPISNNAKKCYKCANRDRRIPLERMRISRESLKKRIRNESFCKIGKDFNVSDNTIRKWCIKMDLPTKANVISAYTDAEWEKI